MKVVNTSGFVFRDTFFKRSRKTHLYISTYKQNIFFKKRKTFPGKKVSDIYDRQQYMTFKTQEIKAWDMIEKVTALVPALFSEVATEMQSAATYGTGS